MTVGFGTVIAGLAFVVLIAMTVLTVYSLTHLVTAGIEWSQPLKFQREDVFPDHLAKTTSRPGCRWQRLGFSPSRPA